MDFKLEYLRCYKDKSRKYFIENYLSTYDASERKEVPFTLFPRQIELIESFNKYNNIITIKPRQSGITTVTSAYITGQLVFASPKSPETVLCIGNKLDISQQLLEKIAEFLEQVPRWMWGSDYYSPDPSSPKNTRSIFKTRNKQRLELFNGCKVYARSSGTNAARGISACSYVIFDEAAFIQNGPSVYTQAIATTNSVENAKIIMISTPNGKDQLYYQTYSKAVKKENNFHVVEFRWYQDPRYNKYLKWYKKDKNTGKTLWNVDPVIDKKGDIEYNEQRWRELVQGGWRPTSPWYEYTCKSFNNDRLKINQELNVSFLGSSDNVVPVETIDMQSKENVIEITPEWPLRDQLVEETWIWKDPIPGHRYICACLPKGERILTDKGYKPIEKISIKDKLYSIDGKHINIVEKMCRHYDGDIYTFRVNGHCTDITYTWNHPLYVSKDNCKSFSYVKAKYVTAGNYVRIPNIYRNATLKKDDILSKWVYDEITNPLLKDAFWKFCGIWLSSGYCAKGDEGQYQVKIDEDADDLYKVIDLSGVIESLFGVKSVVTYGENDPDHEVTLAFKSNIVADFLSYNLCDRYDRKQISEWIKFLPFRLKYQLIQGLLVGSERHDTRYEIYIDSVRAAEDIQDILYSLGVASEILYRSADSIYILKLCEDDIYQLSDVDGDAQTSGGRRKQFFSDDLSYIYIMIDKVVQKEYKGVVYNFETETHNYCTNKMVVHNCDGSSGAGEDFTAIQVIDVDAIDDNGLPYFDQVLEYNGKVYGNEAGQLVDRYGRIYNNALVVVDGCGGYGDAICLTLLDLNYPNLYYDDPSLKNYTNKNLMSNSNYGKEAERQLPGYRTSSLRLKMISFFVNMLVENSFRVRSSRTINELETWVFKNGRPDHQDGCHDDLLTCLSMGLFVMQFYMLRRDKAKDRDVKMTQSWVVNKTGGINRSPMQSEKTINIADVSRNYPLPFYGSKTQNDEQKRFMAMMLLGCVIKK